MSRIYKIIENAKLNGLEIHFDDGKPSKEYLQCLANLGFRWSKKAECWYHRNFAELKPIVRKYLDNVEVEEDDDDDGYETSRKSRKGQVRKSASDHSIADALNALAENQSKMIKMFSKLSPRRNRR